MCAIFAYPVYGFTDISKLSLEELMNIEVATVYGASKFEQKTTEAPSSITIVTSDEIKKYGRRALADILRGVGGFYVTYDRNSHISALEGSVGQVITIAVLLYGSYPV